MSRMKGMIGFVEEANPAQAAPLKGALHSLND